MSGRAVIVVALLSSILCACVAGTELTASPPAPLTPSYGPSSLATVRPSPTTVAATMTAPVTPGPDPQATVRPAPIPIPPKPSGLGYDGLSDLEAAGIVRLTWQAPRTRGVEIRVYGVTRCLPDDEGTCLGVHTPLPDNIRVLLAKAPASQGKVTWDQAWGDIVPIEDDPDWACTTTFESGNGTPYFSVVVAAYGAGGNSVFSIVDPGWLGEADVCPS